jgi:hypothetical protein
VHNRADYISDFKKASHLNTGDERWGEFTNTGEWAENVVNFLREHKDSDNYDFVLGYCVHVLSDVFNTITAWNPFRFKYPEEIKKGYGNIHHQESNKVDIELALTLEGREDFWRYIRESKAADLYGLIFADEVEMQKDYILNRWYRDKERPDFTDHKFVTVESIMKFIEDATIFVLDKIN